MTNGEITKLIRWGFVAAIVAALVTTATLTVINFGPHDSILKQRAELKAFRVELAEDIETMRVLLTEAISGKCRGADDPIQKQFHYLERRNVGPDQEQQRGAD